jgi:uncharacterized protein (TIGR02246 family)
VKDALAVLEAQVDAWNRGDLDGFMAGYADDVIFTSGGEVRRGRDQTMTRYRETYGGALRGRLAFEIVEVQGLGPDGAVVLGRWSLDDTGGVFTVVLARRAEGWRVIHDHTTVSDPRSS